VRRGGRREMWEAVVLEILNRSSVGDGRDGKTC
jgi:hypothetical protein